MIICYTFIGPLPSYAVDTVHQLRLFYKGDVYFILNDYNSPYLEILKTKYNINIIKYDDVIHKNFSKLVNDKYHKFCIVPRLKGREKLFIYSFERFYILYVLMLRKNLSNVFFLELDNLIYDDPLKWEASFSEKDIQYMYDNKNRCSSGICYIKNTLILSKLLNTFSNFISTSNDFIDEMTGLYKFYTDNPDLSIGFLPIHWSNEQENPKETFEQYGKYGETIFDAAAMGIYLGGVDPVHSGGKLVKGIKWQGSILDYTNYKFKWEKDDCDRFIPYIQTKDGQWLKINNLHVHSKELIPCLSDQPKD